MSDTNLTQINDAELDLVGAGTGIRFRSINFGNVLIAKQTNTSFQGSVNVLSAGSGNQSVVQQNNASIG
jgi:hypothetical protein